MTRFVEFKKEMTVGDFIASLALLIAVSTGYVTYSASNKQAIYTALDSRISDCVSLAGLYFATGYDKSDPKIIEIKKTFSEKALAVSRELRRCRNRYQDFVQMQRCVDNALAKPDSETSEGWDEYFSYTVPETGMNPTGPRGPIC